MINKITFKKPRIKYGIIGFCFLILIYILSILTYTTIHFVENFVNVLIIIPFELYLRVYPLLNICPYNLKSECILYGLNLVIFTAPIYYGILGFLIGWFIEKIRKKK